MATGAMLQHMSQPLPPLKLPRTVRRSASRAKAGALFALAGLLLIALFVFRTIPLTADDEFYLEYFSSSLSYNEFADNVILFLADEPLFRLYTALSAALLSPQAAVRLLIFFTLLPHFLVASRLSPSRAWAYFGGYLLFVELAPHLSWVQLRQGLAVAVLGWFLYAGRHLLQRWRLAGLFCIGLIHTSMLILLPCFALAALKKRRLAYAIVIMVSLALFAVPDIVGQLSFLMGRREAAYLDESPAYSIVYVLFSVGLMAYVTYHFRDKGNSGEFLTYHAMCGLVLPLFFMTTVGAFAERLFFVVRLYELHLVTRPRSRKAGPAMAGYMALNIMYTIYHSVVNFGGGGVLDRYLMMVTSR